MGWRLAGCAAGADVTGAAEEAAAVATDAVGLGLSQLAAACWSQAEAPRAEGRPSTKSREGSSLIKREGAVPAAFAQVYGFRSLS